MLYPWELTAWEWLGARLHTRKGHARTPAKLKAAPLPIGEHPREKYAGVWVEIPPAGGVFGLCFDGPELGAELVAVVGWDRAWCHRNYRGRALLARVCAERFTRHGRSELEYLRQSVYGSAFTLDGKTLSLRAHRIAVLAAAARGVPVAARVVQSLDETEGFMVRRNTAPSTRAKRTPARAPKAPAAAAPTSAPLSREERRKAYRDRKFKRRNAMKEDRDLRRRHGAVPIGRGLVERLRAFARDNAEGLALLARFEKLIFVVDDEATTSKPRKPRKPRAPRKPKTHDDDDAGDDD
jgi:hypothetical protein